MFPFKESQNMGMGIILDNSGNSCMDNSTYAICISFCSKGELMPIIHEAPSSAKMMAIFFGALWGFGGLTFGLSIRYLGVALGSKHCIKVSAQLSEP